jgi:GT2 family glycosyltransferase
MSTTRDSQMNEKLNAGSQLTSATPQVGIVILNWNGRDVLQDCLRSISCLRYPRFEVILVDNGSKDGSREMLNRDYPDVPRIENEVNVGFAAGNNQGIRLALERGNDYVMVLNNDTILDPDCLTWLVQRAQSDPQIGAVSPKIYFAEPSDRLWFAGGTFNYWTGRNGHVGYKNRDVGAWDTRKEIQFVCGCSFVAPRRVWQEVGGFDERFFRSSEDVDWSLRVRKAGYRLFYEPSSIIWHRESFDIIRNEGMAGILYFWTRNNLAVMYKQACWCHWLTFLPYFGALSLKRILVAMRTRDWAALRAILRGIKDFPALAREIRVSGRQEKFSLDRSLEFVGHFGSRVK